MIRMRLMVFALLAIALASCGGGSQRPQSVLPGSAGSQSGSRQTLSLNAAGGFTGSITLRSDSALPASDIELSAKTCSSMIALKIRNHSALPRIIDVDSFTVTLPCTPQAPLYGATFFQLKPQPSVVSPIKLGDATVVGRTVTFTSIVGTITLPPRTTSQISIVPESSKNEVTFPVAPGSTTELTANAPGLPSGLSFTYATASGGNTYTAACFNAFVNGTLAQALRGVPLVGIPSFYCHVEPVGSAPITFGNVVTFTIGDPKPDRPVFEPDGNAQGFICNATNQCNVPQFTIPTTYQNFIAGNVQELRLCVPATADVDCNGVAGDPQGGSLTSIRAGRNFQVFVADDPTYKSAPGNPWDGLLRIHLSGPCALSTLADPNNGDVPPGYSDFTQTGVGPNAEFDVKTTGVGTCLITTSEDPRYITDDSSPANPKPRSASISISLTKG